MLRRNCVPDTSATASERGWVEDQPQPLRPIDASDFAEIVTQSNGLRRVRCTQPRSGRSGPRLPFPRLPASGAHGSIRACFYG